MQGAWLYTKGACCHLLQLLAAAEPLPGRANIIISVLREHTLLTHVKVLLLQVIRMLRIRKRLCPGCHQRLGRLNHKQLQQLISKVAMALLLHSLAETNADNAAS